MFLFEGVDFVVAREKILLQKLREVIRRKVCFLVSPWLTDKSGERGRLNPWLKGFSESTVKVTTPAQVNLFAFLPSLSSTTRLIGSTESVGRPTSRVKEWFGNGSESLSVSCGFPSNVSIAQSLSVTVGFPNSVSIAQTHGCFTIPFPSHRTFSSPEYGGPTVFIAKHSQFYSRT